MTDEIIEELWKIKDDMAREHDYDLDTLVADLRLRLREQYPSQFNHDIDETYKDIIKKKKDSKRKKWHYQRANRYTNKM